MKQEDKPPSTIASRILQATTKLFSSYSSGKEQLIRAVSDLKENDAVDKRVSEIISHSLEAQELDVRDIMIPRTAMVSLSENDSLHTMVRKVAQSGHSRLPVLTADGKDALGTVHVKDSLQLALDGKFSVSKKGKATGTDSATLKSIIRKCGIIPEGKDVIALLDEFRVSRTHLAIVLDEYGSVSGLVTIEDVLEVLVGDIIDEHDAEVAHSIVADSSGNGHIVRGETTLDAFNKKFDTKLSASDITTISGWVILELGRIPKAEEHFSFNGLKMEMKKVNTRAIKEIFVRQEAVVN